MSSINNPQSHPALRTPPRRGFWTFVNVPSEAQPLPEAFRNLGNLLGARPYGKHLIELSKACAYATPGLRDVDQAPDLQARIDARFAAMYVRWCRNSQRETLYPLALVVGEPSARNTVIWWSPSGKRDLADIIVYANAPRVVSLEIANAFSPTFPPSQEP
jgi:hypothetical protein